MTSAIVAPAFAAANIIGASSFAAAAYQKSESLSVRLPTEAPSASQAAVRRAIAQSTHPSSGDQLTLSSCVSPAGSNSCTLPSARRASIVSRSERATKSDRVDVLQRDIRVRQTERLALHPGSSSETPRADSPR